MHRSFVEPTGRATKLLVVVLVALAIVGGTYAVVQAAAKPAVAAPVIGSGPADPTNATVATFTFSSTQPGVSFQCALDRGAMVACTSPTSYAGLSEGVHTFRVRASNSRGEQSATVTATWTIDTTPPPAPVLTATPAPLTSQTDASFSFTGNAGEVTLRCQLDGSAFAACTSPQRYAGPLGQGSHTFAVSAVDRAGNVGPATSFTWTVDTTPPPAPAIGSGPTSPTTDKRATFAFSDAEAGVAFRCRLDQDATSGCTSPTTYSGLRTGTHTFEVQALDPAGNASAFTSTSWTVEEEVAGFTLGGSLPQLLHPGAVAGLDVRVTNPFAFAINVAQLTVTVRQPTTRDGQPNPACDGTVNLRVLRPYSGPVPLRVPARSTLSLSDLGVPPSQWPQLTMPDLQVNQDACKRTTFAFGYAATATKVNQ